MDFLRAHSLFAILAKIHFADFNNLLLIIYIPEKYISPASGIMYVYFICIKCPGQSQKGSYINTKKNIYSSI